MWEWASVAALKVSAADVFAFYHATDIVKCGVLQDLILRYKLRVQSFPIEEPGGELNGFENIIFFVY